MSAKTKKIRNLTLKEIDDRMQKCRSGKHYDHLVGELERRSKGIRMPICRETKLEMKNAQKLLDALS